VWGWWCWVVVMLPHLAHHGTVTAIHGLHVQAWCVLSARHTLCGPGGNWGSCGVCPCAVVRVGLMVVVQDVCFQSVYISAAKAVPVAMLGILHLLRYWTSHLPSWAPQLLAFLVSQLQSCGFIGGLVLVAYKTLCAPGCNHPSMSK
jgi:hypothetical protein